MNYNRKELLNVLLVEDSRDDFEALREAFNKKSKDYSIYHCEDGDDAIDFVYQKGSFTDKYKAPRPKVILLDLNLPGTDGKEVLKEIKSSDSHKHIPVVVFTTSNNPTDIKECYEMGANGYMQKPMEYDQFDAVIDKFQDYWFNTSVLPNGI
jgi:CheY-like chemotaxis protein